MELSQYIKIIKKNIVLVIAITIFGAAIGFYFSKSVPSGFSAVQTFFITSLRETSPLITSLQDPQADTPQSSYYSLEKSRDFTDAAVAILESPDFTDGLTPAGSISVRKQAPQVIKITANAKGAQEAKSLMGNTISSFNTKIQSLSQSNSFQLKAVGILQAPQVDRISPNIVIAFGLAVGFVASIIVISLKIYFRL